MTPCRWALLPLAISLAAMGAAARPQQQQRASAPDKSLNDKSLNDTQKLGQRVFQQRCGICHEAPRPGFQMYGPALYKDLVAGSEDAIKEIIRAGTTKMPGFRYGLQPAEIDAIVEYLKTVPKPQKTAGAAAPGSMDPLD